MEFAVLLLTPLLGSLLLAVWGARPRAAEINIALSFGTFLAAVAVTARVINEGNLTAANEQFFLDPFNVFLVTLTAFVGLTTSIFSRPYMRIEMEHGRLSEGRLRLYHSMYQLFMTMMLVALTTNNMGLILCGVGIAQALFGTILLYFAAEKVLGAEGVSALLWTHLAAVKGELEPTVLGLAFAFLLVGYGTKVGLAPLHNWLPDAHAEGPTPVSAVLSGLLLNVAMYAVVRCKILVEGALQSTLPSKLLMVFGLLSVVLSALFLWRQRDIKRLFAYSSIEHMGIIAFAFGMGGAVANFAALLHMTVHSLTKSAIFFTVGHAAQKAGSQKIEDIRGLLALNPTIGWGLMLGSLAILGFPPFGVFASEFLILTTAMQQEPWATPILLLALGVAFAAIFSRVQSMVLGQPAGRRLPHQPALLPVFAHLALVLLLGLYIPPYLADWYRAAASMIVGQ
ncbi:MAG: hydrogenase 4 subunit F [Proteobacteria bacterium]|nr:hydrogenase 4 subunit F [Pseudomonadota bacterium]